MTEHVNGTRPGPEPILTLAKDTIKDGVTTLELDLLIHRAMRAWDRASETLLNAILPPMVEHNVAQNGGVDQNVVNDFLERERVAADVLDRLMLAWKTIVGDVWLLRAGLRSQDWVHEVTAWYARHRGGGVTLSKRQVDLIYSIVFPETTPAALTSADVMADQGR